MAPFLGALSYLNLNLKKISVPILSRRGSSVTVNVRMLFYATLPANSRRTGDGLYEKARALEAVKYRRKRVAVQEEGGSERRSPRLLEAHTRGV